MTILFCHILVLNTSSDRCENWFNCEVKQKLSMKRISWTITLGAKYDNILKSSLCEDCSKSSFGSYRKELLWLELRGNVVEEIELEDLDLSRFWA
jgi:hypothetical protein